MKSLVPSKEISIFIPAKNRPDLLINMLRYFCKNNFEGPIYIGDSSSPEHVEKVKKELVALKGKINVVYAEYPGWSGPKAVSSLLSQVSTPYAVYTGDDDFLVPSALVQCASFLERSSEFSVCSGKAILIAHKNGSSEISAGSYGTYRDLLGETASQRFLDFMSSYFVTLFAVHRTEAMKEAYKGIDTLPDWGFTELLPSCYSILQGKIKTIDCLSLVRQCHGGFRQSMPNVYDWLTCERWLPSYQQFESRLASLLSKKDNISIEQSHEIIKKCFWGWLAKGLYRKWMGQHQGDFANFKDRLKTSVKTIPLATQFWRTLYSYMPRGKMTLPSLLRRSSPYHTDFLPVYQAIQNIKQ